MRNAIDIGHGFIVTTDNAGGIGEKADDIVSVPNRVTAYFTARVALLEQWAGNAMPISILIHNFSGSSSWDDYVAGVKDLFREADLELPEISGSTETNMDLKQSGLAVTMIGKKSARITDQEVEWFAYGQPLVGKEVMAHANEIASIGKLHKAIQAGIIDKLWPVGSQGILSEIRALTGNEFAEVKSPLDTKKSAGPSTVVLLAIPIKKTEVAKAHFDENLTPLHFIHAY